MTPYDQHRVHCAETAVIFEKAAELARKANDLFRARSCSEQAWRLRYLAEHDHDVAELFNQAAAK